MIAMLKEAAQKAAELSDLRKSITLTLADTGVLLSGRTENERVGYTLALQVGWDKIDSKPSVLIWSIERIAAQLDRRCDEIDVIRLAPRGEAPPVQPVRLIPLEDRPLAIACATVLVFLVPLAGGLF